MKRHSHGAKVGGSTRNRISHAGTRGRLTENPVRPEIPVGVRKSVSRCEICISRRELYISRRDFYISRREIDFTWCGGKFPQGCRSPCQAARQTQGRHACRRDGCRAAASGCPQIGNRRQCDRSPDVTSGAPTFPVPSATARQTQGGIPIARMTAAPTNPCLRKRRGVFQNARMAGPTNRRPDRDARTGGRRYERCGRKNLFAKYTHNRTGCENLYLPLPHQKERRNEATRPH